MVDQSTQCTLCGLSTFHPLYDDHDQPFCCPACLEVSQLLASDTPAAPPAVSASADLATATLHLGGLWCPSCSWLIGESLSRADGIDKADVNFLQRQAQVVYDPARTEPKKLLKLVRRVGYRAWLPGEKPYDDEEAHWNRLLVAGVLVMNIMMFSFALYIRDWAGRASPDTEWLVNIFHLWTLMAAIPVMLLLGLPILRAGAASLLRGRPNLHTLIALGAFSAFALSLRHMITGSGQVYFDTAAVLLFLVSVGRWLEMRAQKRSTQVVERLYEQLPGEATQITSEGERQLPIDQVQPGMRLRVRPGERFPADGVIAAGRGYVDESLLTGEPDPVVRTTGGRALAGTINLDGSFEVIASAVGPETVAGQIGHLLHQALWQRAPVERLADRLAAYMTPLAAALAVAAFAFWSWRADVDTGLTIALSVLLIACPCALGIATPLTLWQGLGRAAGQGILLRSTAVLERLAAATTLFFDKTGTLTQRPMRLQAIHVHEVDEAEFVTRVAAIEQQSQHPLAQAIVQGLMSGAWREQETDILPAPPSSPPSDFRALPGLGVVAELDGQTRWVGSRRLMEQQGLALSPDMDAVLRAWREKGWTVVYAGWEGAVRGLLALGENARPDAASALASLRRQGYDVVVLTGDDAAAGERWRRHLGAPVFAEQSPEDKLAKLVAREGTVMVGDGINDGPALAAADVGIALGHGADVAQAAADVILIKDNLNAVPWLMALASATMRKVRQNLAWAFAYNLVGLSLAVTGHLQPSIAALFMVGSSVIVTSNALRLQNEKLNVDLSEAPPAASSQRPGAASPAAIPEYEDGALPAPHPLAQ